MFYIIPLTYFLFYSYARNGDHEVQHHVVDTEDVGEFSGELSKDDITFHQDELVDLDSFHIIHRSTGSETIGLSQNVGMDQVNIIDIKGHSP